ncbi:peptidylprolyl isomerase [Cellulosilyticum sp. I15G10I2]|uniref:peptidylprolyl isomerase n=1 Tax=Cellulosilyticum sp. I15G10I2 TaxID=1892843 RepID=UPI00085CBC18|nr:peptidylprolyl isomerase [Cellulosilyticum sp. I15G10I2]
MKRVKKILARLLAATMITIMLIGCGATENTVVTINNEKISESLYRIYLWTTQQEFESLTPNIWDMELEGKKTEDVAKERALDSIKLSVAAKQRAKELGIQLSREEKSSIKDKSKEIIQNRPELVKELGFKQRDVEEFLSYGSLIEKVIQRISESYMPNEDEISAEMELIRSDYEKVTVKHVLIGNKDEQGDDLPADKMEAAQLLAEEILQKALAGEDVAELAKKYSEDPGSKDSGGEYTFGRGRMVPEFEEASFTGEVGKVYPKLVETSYGYHIIKIENHELGSEDQIKEDSRERIKQRFAANELTELSEAMKVEKTEAYNNIHIIRSDTPNAAESQAIEPSTEILVPESENE